MQKDLERAEPVEPVSGKGPQRSITSKLRLRLPDQTAPFTHAASHCRSDDSSIVDFDGPEDLYRPINWRFEKKALTTILYGMTTMGVTWASSMYALLCILD